MMCPLFHVLLCPGHGPDEKFGTGLAGLKRLDRLIAPGFCEQWVDNLVELHPVLPFPEMFAICRYENNPDFVVSSFHRNLED